MVLGKGSIAESSFYRSFALVLILAVITSYYFRFISKDFLAVSEFINIFSAGIFIIIFANVSNASRYHLEARLRALRWPMVKEVLKELSEKGVEYSSLCTKKFMYAPENTYDYWALYLSDYLDKKVTFITTKSDTDKCDVDIEFNYSLRKRNALLTLAAKQPEIYISKMRDL